MHLGADPVHRERDEAHALLGVEALHGLHQADVAFLDEVRDLQPVALVAARHVHHETQVREHQALGGLEVVGVDEAAREVPLFLGGEHRHLVHRVDVRVQAAERARDGQVVGDQGVAHSDPLQCDGTLAVGPLEC